ncbi:MAG: sugar porter family MFS transporter [Gammaproteobacteria bacterium]|nr:sugar porter family MFS transporter [Gammaproteobacteria bacterium]
MISKTSYNINFIALCAAISGLLFGYDAGIISGAMLFIKKTFYINNTQIGEMVGAVPFGALISSLIIGKLSDFYGRKKLLLTTAILFSIGSLSCAIANSAYMLILSRLLIGFAIGMSSSLSPVYIAEIAEKAKRGKLVTLYLISINFGIFISYLTNLSLAYTESWRVMLGLGVIPAMVLLAGSFFLPESPRWLIIKGKINDGKNILEKTHGKEKAKLELNKIDFILKNKNSSFKFIFQSKFFKLIVLGALIGIFTQAVGINAIIYYAPTIFQKTGFNKVIASMLATLGIGFTVTLSAIIAANLIDKFGRRTLLLTGLFGIILSLCIIILSFSYIHNPIILGWFVLIGFISFVACQGLSVGPACFLLPAEIYPARIRGIGMGISITFNWLTNFLVAFLFPVAINTIGIICVFKIFLLLSIAGFVIFYFYIPETKKTSLENIEINIMKNEKLRWIGEEKY